MKLFLFCFDTWLHDMTSHAYPMSTCMLTVCFHCSCDSSFWIIMPVWKPTSYPGSSLFLPRESTLVSAGHVSPISKQLPTRVDSLFFKKRREKRMQIFSNWHEDRGMEVISSLFSKDRDAEKIYSLLSAAFQKHK